METGQVKLLDPPIGAVVGLAPSVQLQAPPIGSIVGPPEELSGLKEPAIGEVVGLDTPELPSSAYPVAGQTGVKQIGRFKVEQFPKHTALEKVGTKALEVGVNTLGLGEAALSGITGLGAFFPTLAAQLAGLTVGGPAKAEKWGGAVSEALTYKPKTEQGQASSEVVNAPFTALQKGLDAAAESISPGDERFKQMFQAASGVAMLALPALKGRIKASIYENITKGKPITTGEFAEVMRETATLAQTPVEAQRMNVMADRLAALPDEAFYGSRLKEMAATSARAPEQVQTFAEMPRERVLPPEAISAPRTGDQVSPPPGPIEPGKPAGGAPSNKLTPSTPIPPPEPITQGALPGLRAPSTSAGKPPAPTVSPLPEAPRPSAEMPPFTFTVKPDGEGGVKVAVEQTAKAKAVGPPGSTGIEPPYPAPTPPEISLPGTPEALPGAVPGGPAGVAGTAKAGKRVPPPPMARPHPFMDWIIENGKISWPKIVEAGFKGEFEPLREWATKNKKKIFTNKETGQSVGDITEKMNEISTLKEAGINELVDRLHDEMFGKPSPIDEVRMERHLAAEEKKTTAQEIEYYKSIENEYGYPRAWDEPLGPVASSIQAEQARMGAGQRVPKFGEVEMKRQLALKEPIPGQTMLEDMIAKEEAPRTVPGEVGVAGTEPVAGEINPPADQARVRRAIDEVNIGQVFDELSVPANVRSELYMRILRNWKPEDPGGLKQYIKTTLWKQIDPMTHEWIDKEAAQRIRGKREEVPLTERTSKPNVPVEGEGFETIRLAEEQARVDKAIRQAVSGTNAERDASIVRDRILHDDTFADIGRRYGISGEAARQIYEKAASALRENPEFKEAAGKRKGMERPGFIDPNLIAAGVPSFVKEDVIPKSKELARMVVGSARDIRNALAPAAATPEAARTAEIVRYRSAQMHRAGHIAEKALNKARGYFSAKDPNMTGVGLDFIDTIETGKRSADPYLDMVAGIIKKELDKRVDQVRALGTGKLEEVIENYFPHAWSDPKKAAGVFQEWYAKRPLEGSKAFLKKRTVPTTKEGIARGLVPRTTNPVELALLKMREMDKYIMAQKVLANMKGEGLAKFVRATERPPEGWRQINDKISTVYGNPNIAVKEAFDKSIMDGLGDVATALGVSHERVAHMRGQVWGRQQPGGTPEIKTRFGGPESVLAHEIGHAIDDRYDVHKSLLSKGPKINKELRALADARYEGLPGVTNYYKRYVRKGTEKAAVMAEAYVHAPDKFREVAPGVMDWFEGLVEKDPALSKLKNVKASLVLGSRDQGLKIDGRVIRGYYYAPAEAARIINNYLSPGIRGNDLFRAYLGLANTMNQAQLGLSAFHLGFTSIDAITSKVGLAAVQASHGDLGKAAKSIASAPLSPVTNIIRGSKLYREYETPGSMGPEIAALVEGMEKAGGRAHMEKFYATGYTDAMVKALRKGNLPGAVWRLPWSIIEQSARPIMEFIVPRQKLGVFADLARYEMDRLAKAGATEAEKTTALTKAWNSVDNRMGQLVYDNLFWNKIVKDLGMASVRSLGWNIGTLREIGGGAVDTFAQLAKVATGKKPELTYRMSYLIALPVVVGTMGAVTNYLFTGELPKELKDYFYPRTNQVDENGEPLRVALPSYMKDIYHFSKEPGRTLKNKLHPALSSLSQMLENRDFYGTQIADWEGTPGQIAKEYGEYALKTLQPLGIRNMLREKKAGASPLIQGMQFGGITPAPVSVTRTQAENTMARIFGERPIPTRTKEQAETYDIKRQVKNTLKSGRPVTPELKAKAATLSERQMNDVTSDLKKTYFEDHFNRLSLREALRVYEITTPEERKMAMPILAHKISTAAENDSASIEKNIERIRALFPRRTGGE